MDLILIYEAYEARNRWQGRSWGAEAEPNLPKLKGIVKLAALLLTLLALATGPGSAGQ